jgi:hypothetical protein
MISNFVVIRNEKMTDAQLSLLPPEKQAEYLRELQRQDEARQDQ